MGAVPTGGELTRDDRGPDEIWRTAWEAERGALLAFLRHQVRDSETAEDLLQETFVRAIRSGRIDDTSTLRSYLFTIAQNLAADHWRRRFRLLPKTAEAPGGRDGEGLEAVPDRTSESPEATASRRGIERRVRQALAALPDHYRSAFRLAAIEQRSYREIGVAMGWTLDQVRINVHRARKRLIAELGDGIVAEMRT
jgi:RNA polymerase sigma-70 factor (ECF subfamily)